jgi:hypothetical protein
MTHDQIAQALAGLRPGAQWSLIDDDYSGLEWLDDAQSKPTESEVASYVPATPVPQTISDRQFFQQLANAGIISEAEALASNAAVIPAPLLAIIDQMPADQQFGAKMIVSGATTFFRDNPMTIAIGTAYGMTPEQINEFFRAAASL